MAADKPAVLVTGANGQLGNEFRTLVEVAGGNYIFTDVDELDITDLGAVRKEVKDNSVDVIVNCAAYTDVNGAEDNAETAGLINRKAAENLAHAAKEQGATLVHISTDYVFNGEKNAPYREDDATNPLGVYGLTKLQGEKAIQDSGCRYLVFRTSWLYSGFGNNFVKTMLRLTSEKEAVNVVFDQTGTPTYAGDLAKAVYDIVQSGKYRDNAGIYHYSNEGVCSWYDFAHEIALLAGNIDCRVEPCHSSQFPSKVKRPAYSVLDKTKIKQTFGIEIPHWRDSLAKFIENHDLYKNG